MSYFNFTLPFPICTRNISERCPSPSPWPIHTLYTLVFPHYACIFLCNHYILETNFVSSNDFECFETIPLSMSFMNITKGPALSPTPAAPTDQSVCNFSLLLPLL